MHHTHMLSRYLRRQQPFWIFRSGFGKTRTSLFRCSVHSFRFNRFDDISGQFVRGTKKKWKVKLENTKFYTDTLNLNEIALDCRFICCCCQYDEIQVLSYVYNIEWPACINVHSASHCQSSRLDHYN